MDNSDRIDIGDETLALSRSELLNWAGLIQGGLVLLTLVSASLTGVNLWERCRFDRETQVVTAISTSALLVLLAVLSTISWTPFRKIWETLEQLLAPSLRECRWWDLLLLAALAGISEEVCFRGLLPAWFSPIFGKVITATVVSVAFGSLHGLTWTYFIMATLLAGYFAWLTESVCDGNLLPAIIGHAVYDWAAFLVLLRKSRVRHKLLP